MPIVALPPELETLEGVVCEWSTHSARVRVAPGSDEQRVAEIVVADAHMTYRRRVALGYVTVSARDEIEFEGIGVPSGHIELRVRQVDPDGTVTLVWPEPEGLSFPEELRAQASCERVSQGWASAERDVSQPPLRKASIPPDRPVEIALRPGGPPVAKTDPDVIMPNLSVIEDRDGWSKVEWFPAMHLIQGWIRTTDLEPTRPHGPDCCADDHDGGGEAPLPPPSWQCDHDVPLVLEQHGDRRVVGQVQRGAWIEAAPTEHPWVRIERVSDADRRSTRTAPEGTNFLVRSSDMSDCIRGPMEVSSP